MELINELSGFFTLGNVFLLLVLLIMLQYLVEFYEFRGMPPGPRLYSIPFFGNFFSFDNDREGMTLRESTKSLVKQYGKVFSLRLGSYKTVVAASPESIKEMLVNKSTDYAGRPPFQMFLATTLGGKDIAFSSLGPAWRLHRKLFVTALRLYLKDTPLVERNVGEQLERLRKYIADQNGKPFNPSKILAVCVANVICGVTFGERFNSSHPDFDRLLELSDRIFVDGMEITNEAKFWDFFPFAKYLPIKCYKEFAATYDEMFAIVGKQLKKGEEEFDPNQPIGDLISGLIKARNEAEVEDVGKNSELLSDDYLLNTITDMFSAGFETTSATLNWAILYLTNFPDIQTKIQQELDDVVGRDKLPTLEDRPNLPLLQATTMEVQRLANIVDCVIPHYTMTDTTLCGYRVPKNTVVLADLESIHLDPTLYENPGDFNPYRHLDNDGKLTPSQGNNFLPFSAGRRSCAGEPLAKVELFLFLSAMLQKYKFVPEEGKKPPKLEGKVVSLKAPLPYMVCAVKR